MAEKITRRALMSTGSTLVALGVVGMVASQYVPAAASDAASVAAEPDPILAAIDRHREARDRLDAFENEGAAWDVVNAAERAAWDEFAETHPTTPAGLAAMTAYVLHSPAGYEDEDRMRRALASVASCTARLAHTHAGRA